MKHRKVLVLATLSFAFLCIVALFIHARFLISYPFSLDPKGTIVLGSEEAPIELVLFEDFQCSHCQDFSNYILPRIQDRYIDSNQVRFTLVPLPFFSGSKALSNVALTIFHDTPDRLFPFLKQSYQNFPNYDVTDEALLEIAESVGGIDLEEVKTCIEEHCYYANIQRNFRKARNIMKKQVVVPTLYINGSPASTTSFEEIASQIEAMR
jgi:protein-disulfide isomerase